jgi:hypothetical protein
MTHATLPLPAPSPPGSGATFHQVPHASAPAPVFGVALLGAPNVG